MHLTLMNLLGVATIAFFVPFTRLLPTRAHSRSHSNSWLESSRVRRSSDGSTPAVVSVMSSIGVAFLLFLAGLELDPGVMKGPTLVRGSLSFLLSFTLALAFMTPLGGARDRRAANTELLRFRILARRDPATDSSATAIDFDRWATVSEEEGAPRGYAR